MYPVYAFNETILFKTVNVFEKLRLILNKFKIPGTIYIGYFGYPLAPNPNVELKTVIGTGIRLPHIINPTKEDISFWHNEYKKSLNELYKQHSTRNK